MDFFLMLTNLVSVTFFHHLIVLFLSLQLSVSTGFFLLLGFLIPFVLFFEMLHLVGQELNLRLLLGVSSEVFLEFSFVFVELFLGHVVWGSAVPCPCMFT